MKPTKIKDRKHVSLIIPGDLYARLQAASLEMTSKEREAVGLSEVIRRALLVCFPDNQMGLFEKYK